MNWLSQNKTLFRLTVTVSPNAKKTEIVSSDDTLKIKLQAPPVDGKANEALIAFFAKRLRLPKRNIQITHGTSSKKKLVDISADSETKESLIQKLLG